MRKIGTVAEIDNVWRPMRGVKTASATKAAEELQIVTDIPEDITFSDDYVYSTVRAISARVNMNMDGFTKEELLGTAPDWIDNDLPNKGMPAHNDKFGYRTFVGKNNHVDHYNQPEVDHGDPLENARHAPRGKILWAWYEEDPLEGDVKLAGFPDPVTKKAGKDVWIKLLIANKRSEFPVLCRAIEDGYVTKVSMGAEVVGSSCAVCGKFAGAPWDYCEHIRYGRGQPFAAESGSDFVKAGVLRERDPVLAFENNHGLQFFEESWILDIQADPTAVIMDLIKGEPGSALKGIQSSKTAGKKDYKQILLDLINGESQLNPEDLQKVAILMDKEAGPVNLNVDNIESLVNKQKLENDQMFMEQNVTLDGTKSEKFDVNVPPNQQPGAWSPDRSFPCSAIDSANKANPEYPMDSKIDVGMCQGCIYNATDKIDTVDCRFDEVVRPGGGDPLAGKGFEAPDDPSRDSGAQRDDSSGLKNEDGGDILEFPGIQHPPGVRNRLSAFHKLKAMFDIGEGRTKLGAPHTFEDVPEGYTYGDNEKPDEVDTFYHTVGISIPSTQISGEPVDPEGREWVLNNVKAVMAREFGGVRVRGEEGGWINRQFESDTLGQYGRDDKTVIESDTDNLDRGEDFVRSLAFGIQDAFNQYSVEYMVDGKAYFTRDVH